MSPDTVVRQTPRSASRVIEGSAVVIVIDQQKLHTLNEVGTFVWAAAGEDGRALEELIEEVVREFEVEREVAAEDVASFVDELVRLGALDVVGEAR